MKSRRVAAMVNRGLTTSVILCADRFTADSFPTRVIAGARIEAALKVGSYPISIPRNDSALPPLESTFDDIAHIYIYTRMYTYTFERCPRMQRVLLINVYTAHLDSEILADARVASSPFSMIFLDRLSSSHSILLVIFQSAIKVFCL